MKSAKPAKNVVPFPERRVRAQPGRARVPAGRAGDRRDAAVADRPGDRLHRSSRCSAVALAWACVRHGRHRRHRAGQDRPERPHQDDPAVRDRRGARDPRARRPERQGGRRADRARSDHERRRARASEERPDGGAARRGAAARRAGRSDDPLADFQPPAGAAAAADRDAAPAACSARWPSSAPSSPRSTARSAQKEAERATIAATIAKLKATIPLLQERVDIRKTCSTRSSAPSSSISRSCRS